MPTFYKAPYQSKDGMIVLEKFKEVLSTHGPDGTNHREFRLVVKRYPNMVTFRKGIQMSIAKFKYLMKHPEQIKNLNQFKEEHEAFNQLLSALQPSPEEEVAEAKNDIDYE